MNRRGLTVSELVIALVIIGALVAMTVPRIGQSMTKQSMRSARNGVVAMMAKAKASAVQRGSRTALLLVGGNLVIHSRHPVTGVTDTVGAPEDFNNRYGAYVWSSRDSLMFDPRGMGMESGPTTVIVSKGSYSDTIVVSGSGRVLR
jgi:Tfp pilus assembly protein FimT